MFFTYSVVVYVVYVVVVAVVAFLLVVIVVIVGVAAPTTPKSKNSRDQQPRKTNNSRDKRLQGPTAPASQTLGTFLLTIARQELHHKLSRSPLHDTQSHVKTCITNPRNARAQDLTQSHVKNCIRNLRTLLLKMPYNSTSGTASQTLPAG